MLDPLTRCGAAGIGYDFGPFDDLGLLAIGLGHAHPKACELGGYLLDDLRPQAQFPVERPGSGFSREVVGRRPQSAGDDHQIDLAESPRQLFRQIVQAVPDDRLPLQNDAVAAEQAGKLQGVGVQAAGSQKLGTHG